MNDGEEGMALSETAYQELEEVTEEPPPPSNLGSVGAATEGEGDLRERLVQRQPSSEELCCRVCMEGLEAGELISPCKCTGSAALIHTHCLEQWLLNRPGGATNLSCEICGGEYAITMKERLSWARVYSCVACSHLTEGIILLFCLACMGFMLYVIGPTLAAAEPSEKALLIVLFGITLMMSTVALRKVYIRWRRASSVPRINANEEGLVNFAEQNLPPRSPDGSPSEAV